MERSAFVRNLIFLVAICKTIHCVQHHQQTGGVIRVLSWIRVQGEDVKDKCDKYSMCGEHSQIV